MRTPVNNTFIKNAGALGAIQVFNMLFPLVLFPHLTRVFDIADFGLIAFTFYLIQFCSILVDYGFGLHATILIANNADNKEAVSKIIGGVHAAKAALLIPTLLGTLTIPYFVSGYSDNIDFFVITLFAIAGYSFQPLLVFQGLQRMIHIAICSLAGRLSFIALVFFYVNQSEDLLLVAILNAATHIGAAIAGWSILYQIGYRAKWYSLSYTIKLFNDSTEFFVSRLATVIYGAGTSVFIGVFSTPTQVALYAVADQFYRGGIALLSPINQALYPYMAKSRDLKFFRKVFIAVFIGTAISVLIGILTGSTVLLFLFGNEFKNAQLPLAILLLALLFASPSALVGYPLLGAFGNSRAANSSVILAGSLQLAMLAICALFGLTLASEIAMTILVAEGVALASRLNSVRRMNIPIIRKV